MKSRRAVALLIETSNAYARGLLEGVITWNRQHDAWTIDLAEQMRGAEPPLWLARWQGEGIIARIETAAIARAVQKTGLPVVDVSAARFVPEIPWVETNDEAIVKLVLDHLFERGFREFAYYGDPAFAWSTLRRDAFIQRVQAAGCHWDCFDALPPSHRKDAWERDKKRLLKWLSRLPRPIGLMACYDVRARQVLDACRELDIAVPEEMAVVGVDNDRLLCELANPALSSVAPDAHQTGYAAAALLNRMLNGEAVPPEPQFIEPLGIEIRQSSDVLAIDDPDVAAALRFIREHASTGIRVQDVLNAVPLSRRVLESRFRSILGRTPHEEIMRLRMQHVKRLLRETDLSLVEIARRVGIEHVEYLSVAFKRETGRTPRQYRLEAPASKGGTLPENSVEQSRSQVTR